MAKNKPYEPVNSSWIQGIKSINAGVMRMRTHDGSVYDYYGTPKRAKAWIKAGNNPGMGPDEDSSAGKRFHVYEIGDDVIKRVAKKGRYGK
jgi:hypothetical protein